MKIFRKISTLFLLLILPMAGLMAQKNYAADADKAFKHRKYFAAVPLYKKAYAKVKNKIEKKRIIFQIGECYRLTKDPRKAEQQYRKAIKAGYPDPIVYLRLAEVLRAQEKYREAMEQFKTYSKKVPNDPRGNIGYESCVNVQKWQKNPTRYQVANARRINSRNDDFSPVYADKKYRSLVFTSTRKESNNKIDPNTGQGYSAIFITQLDRRGNWSKPVLVDEKRMINTEENNGSATFNRKFNTLYFTRCVSEKKKVHGCQIYYSRKKGKLWAEPEALPIADDSIAVGHPAISRNEKELIFASDLPNGYGGKDLWIAKRRKKTKPFGRPRNLGKNINTRGNEMYPTLRVMDDGTTYLYFSSDGWGGAGGLDILRSEYVQGEWTKPENLGLPINSSADDFGMVFSGARNLVKIDPRSRTKTNCEEMGFFTSNRAGGRGKTDIWEFWLPEIVFTLSGKVRDEQTLQLLEGAKIVLSGSDGSVLQGTTDKNGYYLFNKKQIKKNTTYTLKVSHSGYFANEDGKVTTVGLKESKDLKLDINLKPIPKEPIPLPEIRYKLADWHLLPQYQDSLNGLIEIMKKNPTIVIELSSHTDFRSSTEYNDTLSFKRARSVVDYLITKGIDPERMVPKGYGERRPRLLKNGYTYTTGPYAGVSFPPNTRLTEDYIKNELNTTKEKEAAHQLNRRTEFRILRDDYVPKNSNDTVSAAGVNISLNPVNELPYELHHDTIVAECILNGNTYHFAFDENNEELILSLDVVMDLIRAHKLTKNDFYDADSAFTADGTVKDGMLFNVHSLMVGDKVLYDLEAKVSHKQKAQVVFGDVVLSDYYDYTIDRDKKKFIFE